MNAEVRKKYISFDICYFAAKLVYIKKLAEKNEGNSLQETQIHGKN